MRVRIPVIVALVFSATASDAHHSTTLNFSQEMITLRGRILSTEWVNPHCLFTLEVTDDNGETEEWLVTDVPEATAWYGGQTSLLLPWTLEDFEQINDHIRFSHGIHFTRRTTNLPLQDGFQGRNATQKSWMAMALVAPGPPDDFPLRIMDSPVPGQLVYLDRERYPKLQAEP